MLLPAALLEAALRYMMKTSMLCPPSANLRLTTNYDWRWSASTRILSDGNCEVFPVGLGNNQACYFVRK